MVEAAHTISDAGRWRLGAEAREASRARWASNLAEGLALTVVVLTLLYVLIGNTPYDHTGPLDTDASADTISPVNRYIWLALFGLAAPLFWLKRGELAAALRRTWPVLLLFVWFAITSHFAIDPDASHRRLLLYVLDVLICIAVSMAAPDGRRMHAAMATACAIVTAIDLFSWIFLHAISMTDLGLAGIHSHKNLQGEVALFSAFTCAAFAFGRVSWRARAFWGGVALAATAVLVASLSKTSMGILAGVAVLTPLVLALLRARMRIILGWLSLIVFALAAGLFVWMAVNYAQGGDPFAFISQITFTERTDVWRFVWSQAVSHPWTGVGFGSFWDVDPAVQPSLQTDLWFAQPDAATNEAHNGYLDIFAATGVIGVVGALAVLFRWLGKGIGLMRRSLITPGVDRASLAYVVYLGAFAIMVFVHNFMESSYFTANAMYGVIILLIGVEIDRRSAEPAAAAESHS
jgi:O-antigen ligase